ncbi:MAG TPA: transposase [Patescibacteria group bacterium]|nr:transposase [Patescibacteria group bacterium]
MASRKHPIVNGEIYHVFNRSVGRQPIFLNFRDFQRALEIINFYQYNKPALRFSHFNRLPREGKNEFLSELKTNSLKLINTFAFCLLNNHFHFLIKQVKDFGIIRFLSNFQNSYAKYFNIKNKRNGSLFQAVFKAVRIESDEQLLHVCRYIHLNPYTSFLLKEIKDLENYQWSSFPNYLGIKGSDFIDSDFIMDYFGSMDKFKSFTYDQADYQRRLKEIEYLMLE